MSPLFDGTSSESCCSCGSLTGAAFFTCEACQQTSCRNCRRHLAANDFSLMTKVPAPLDRAVFCDRCFTETIHPALLAYQAQLEQAQGIYFLTKNYRGNVRIMRKYTKRVETSDCDDRRECILRLAFRAVELGFNAIILAEIESEKLHANRRQKTRWKASALPAQIDGQHFELASLRGF